MKRGYKLLAVLVCLLTAVSAFAGGNQDQAADDGTVKAGFIYVGPTGDYGWSYAHEVGRQMVEADLPWLESVFVESVAESDSSRIIDRLVNEEKCDIVFTTSFGYMDDTIAAGEMYPDTTFMHCSGFKQSENVGTYFAELYQIYYLNGIMAGSLTKTDKVGYVGAFAIPELYRHINAFAMGVKVANPNATVDVRWINAWVGPAQAREAAEALIASGCDALAFTEDTPAVIEVGQEHTAAGQQIYTFSHYSPMQQYGPDSVVSGQLVDWGIMYEEILNNFKNGTWTNEDMWWLSGQNAAILGGSTEEAINPKFVEELKSISIDTADLGTLSAYDLVMARYEQMKNDEFTPYVGPIYDQDGTMQIADGVEASKDELLSIMYFVDNVLKSGE